MNLASRRQRWQRRPALGDWGAIGVENERNETVITRGADQLDHGLLAEALHGGLIGVVGDVFFGEQLHEEVVDQVLFFRQRRRTASLRNRLGDVRTHAGLERCLPVRVPLVVCRPEPRDQQNCELPQLCRQCAFEAHVVAETPDAVGKLGAAQQRGERTTHATARAACDGLRDARLLGGHLLRRQRSKPWSAHHISPSRMTALPVVLLKDLRSTTLIYLRWNLLPPQTDREM